MCTQENHLSYLMLIFVHKYFIIELNYDDEKELTRTQKHQAFLCLDPLGGGSFYNDNKRLQKAAATRGSKRRQPKRHKKNNSSGGRIGATVPQSRKWHIGFR
jgi:hypothetical protein